MRIKLNTIQIQYVKIDQYARANSFTHYISHMGYVSKTTLELFKIERFIF